MEKVNVTRTWGITAVVLATIVGAAALFLWVSSPAKAQTGPGCCPPVTIQWQPQSVLEAMFVARIVEDNLAIKNGLQALAKNPDMTVADMMKYVENTYLKTPRLWTRAGWVEGWEEILPVLKGIVAHSESISINTASAVIEYQPFDPEKKEVDIDARATVRMTFSASPANCIMGGDLYHSRVCDIWP